MELINKKIILIVTAVVIIIAICTGIAIYKYSTDSGQNIGTNNTNTINAIVSKTPAIHPTVTPTITDVTPTVNINHSLVNSSETTTGNATPTAMVPPTPSSNPSSYSSVPIEEDGRINIQLYLLPDDYVRGKDYWTYIENNMMTVSDAKASLIKRIVDPNTKVYTYEFVNIANNPLMASNCIVEGKPAYTFTNVPAPAGIYEGYIVHIEKDDRLYKVPIGPTNKGSTATAMRMSSGGIIPGDLTSGTIYGRVHEANEAHNASHPVSGANVTLYYYQPDNTGMVNISNNPQVSGSGSEVGFYRFDGLLAGLYNVTAEKDGKIGYQRINLKGTENGLVVDIYLV